MKNTLLLLALVPALIAAATAPTPAPTTTPTTAPAIIPPVAPLKGKPGKPIPLFNGTDLTGWTWRSTASPASKISDAFTVKDGILQLAGEKAPLGYIATEKSFKNFILTVEQRHLDKNNGGIFFLLHAETAQWPDALQVQGMFGNVGDLINQNASMKKITTDPARTARNGANLITTRLHPNAEKPLGEWNTVVITVENGNLNVTVNGTLQNTATDLSPDTGKVGLQSEGCPMEFRKVELVPIE